MLRIGLVGTGYWGPNYARVIGELPGAELTALCDQSLDALEFMRGRVPSAREFTDPYELFADPSVDAVVVATPTSTHHELTSAALRAGKHVLCEKPLGLSVAQCDELIAVAGETGRVLFVGHTFVFNPAVRRMGELIAAGELGRLYYCHAIRTGLGPIRGDVNALWDLAPHDVSILLTLFGESPITVSARGGAFLRDDVEDVAFATFTFPNDAIASVHVSWLDPYKVRRFTAVGDRRMAVFDDVALDEKLKVFDRGASYEMMSESARGTDFGEYRAVVRSGDVRILDLPLDEPLKQQVASFLQSCRGEREPEVGGFQGRAVVAALEAATESLHRGGAPVDVASDIGRAR